MDYKQAGVDIEAGNEVVRRIRALARGTFTSGVLSDIGSFGGSSGSIPHSWTIPSSLQAPTVLAPSFA